MKTLLVPQVALAVLALGPLTFGQDPSEHGGMVEFRRPHPAPRARVAQQADQPPKLGVMVSETDDGVQISEVFDHSLADRAGLAGGDILFKIGGKRVGATSDIPELLSVFGPGETVGITVIRPGEGLVTLHGKRNAPPPSVEQDDWMPREDGGFLGVELGEAGPHGVAIDGVIPETAAWFAGLDDGDVLVSVNGADMRSGEDVSRAIGSRRVGEMIKFVFLRDGDRHKSKIRLGHRKPDIFNPQGGNMLERGRLPMDFRFDPDEDHRFYFDDDEGRVFFGDGDFEWESFAKDMEDWAEDLEFEWEVKFDSEGLHREHLKDGHTRQLSITIEDGVMTIDRDGESEIIELDVNDSIDDIDFLSPGDVRHGAHELRNARLGDKPADIRVLATPEAAAECAEAAAQCEEAAEDSSCPEEDVCEQGDSIS